MVGRGISIGLSSTAHVSIATHVCATRRVGDVPVSNRWIRSLRPLVDPFVRNAAYALVHHDLIDRTSPPTYRRAFPPRSCSSASRIPLRRSNRHGTGSSPSKSCVCLADVSGPLGLTMCTTSVAEPIGVSSISDSGLSVCTHPFDIEAEGSDRSTLPMLEGTLRSTRRYNLLSTARILG